MTTDQACASCIRPSSLVLCKSEVVVVGFQLQIAGFGGSSVRLRTGAFSFRLLGACFQSQADVSRHACIGYLPVPAHVSIRLLISPHQTRRPTVLPRGRDRDRLCAVCCRRRGACGRTDRALGWPAIGGRRVRGQHAWVSLTSPKLCCFNRAFAFAGLAGFVTCIMQDTWLMSVASLIPSLQCQTFSDHPDG